MSDRSHPVIPELSLVDGGASARILERLLRIHARQPRSTLRLALVLALVTWLPLALLAALQGTALPGSVQEPFSQDFTPHVRFLFALPLLIIADIIIGPRLGQVAGQFVVSGLVHDRQLPAFERIVQSTIRLRDSNVAELIVLGIAYATTALNIGRELGTGVSSWLAVNEEATSYLTSTGWWYVLVSVPIYQFFLFRWIMRLCIWGVFLFRVARLDLHLVSTHPDGVAGLGFVGEALGPTSVIILAASSVLCSAIGTQVLHRGAKLEEFSIAFGVFVVVVIVAFLTPFVVFSPKLAATRRNGVMKYGALATRYVQLFDRRWVKGEDGADETLLGTGDIQSLADMGNSFDRVDGMKLFPIGLSDLRGPLLAAVLPAIPLVLMQFPLEDVVQVLMKVLV